MGKTTPRWLASLRDDLELITREAARAHWPGPTVDSPPFYNYRLEHVRQVERDALRLMDEVGGDRDVVLAAVWIHDRFQPQYSGPDHAARAADWARQHLGSMGFPQQSVESVCFAVGVHSSAPHAIPPGEKEARLLWDADKLSKIGAGSIVAFLCAIAAFPHEVITHATLAQHDLFRLGDARLTVDSFYFQPSRLWAGERLRARRHFVEALAREVAYESDVGRG
jgi:predicted metal-dependent HD superfamily phosphohydrolase